MGFGQAYLIDFGQAKRYLDEDGNHIKDTVVKLRVNEWFASKHAFNFQPHTRRDDIISLVYNMIYMFNLMEEVRIIASTEEAIGPYKVQASAR
jgi:hypothetical protein